jgi:hypothetical protein
MKLNEIISPFKMGDWVTYKDEYIELLKMQDVYKAIRKPSVQITNKLFLSYVKPRYARYRLATENEIKKAKIKTIFVKHLKK